MKGDSRFAVWLDRAGCAIVPDGCTVVDAEVEFLRHALASERMVIRGEAVCRWAEAFYKGRGLKCTLLRSPADELVSCCHGLSMDEAQLLVNDLGPRYQQLHKPVSILDVLPALYPDGPWQVETSRSHAARWLLWLRETRVPEYVEPLLAAQRSQWVSTCQEAVRVAYDAGIGQAAQGILECWLGLGDTGTPVGLGAFPVPVPLDWVDRLREKWASEIIHKGCEAFGELKGRRLPRQLLEAAAAETAKYYSHHPGELTQEIVGTLSEYLSTSQVQHLRALLPPEDPGLCPETIDDVLHWYVERYLPYRSWESEHGDVNAHGLAAAAARSFAEWYLDYYPTALSGGEGQRFLAISQSSKLHAAKSQGVVLWVIADGLHYLDAEELVRCVTRQCSRLSILEQQPVFSTIPTVTDHAKPALKQGLPPSQVRVGSGTDLPNDWAMLSESKDPAEQMRGAHPSDVLVWSLLEPDRSYHKKNDRHTIRKNVDGQLQVLASKIADAAQAVPDGVSLKIVISTDHGRMLGGAAREFAIPEGMVAHGRAAWGRGSGTSLPETGVMLQDDIAYLRGTRFGLVDDCAVVIGDGVFQTSDGKGGQEQFPHGGLYPEEVIVSWVELARDRELPTVKCRVSGKARAGSTGKLALSVENLGDVPVRLVSLRLDLGLPDTRILELHGVVAPCSSTESETDLVQWPTASQASRARAAVWLELRAGDEFECEAELLIQSEEMYSRDTALEDL